MTTNPPVVVCPECGRTAHRRMTKFGIRDDCWECNLHSWSGKPLSTQETLTARSAAHFAFDQLWRDLKLVSRRKAYRMLAEELNLTSDQCHMAQMDKETAFLTVKAVDAIKVRLSLRTREEETEDFKERGREIREKRAQRESFQKKQERGTALTQIQEGLLELQEQLEEESRELSKGDTFALPTIEEMPEEERRSSLHLIDDLPDDIDFF